MKLNVAFVCVGNLVSPIHRPWTHNNSHSKSNPITFAPSFHSRSRVISNSFNTSSSSDDGNNNNNNNNSNNNSNNNNDDGDDENSWFQSLQPEILAILKAHHISTSSTLSQLPSDLIHALKLNLITPSQLQTYLTSSQTFLFGWLVRNIKAYRDRVLCDNQFLFKLLVQEIVGNGTQLAGEIVMRGSDIFDEMEYVFSDLLVGTVVEAAFVWILAPCVPFPSLVSQSTSKFIHYLKSLPANMFELSTPARTFTVQQRLSCFVYVAAQYFAVGVACGIVGTMITYGLISMQKSFNTEYVQHRPLPEVIPNSLGWGLFMAVSSNTRFQLVEGVERAVGNALGSRMDPKVMQWVILTIRFLNNYWGGIQFVQMFRWLGLQSTSSG